MKCIEENSQRIDLLQKTLALEDRQNLRIYEMNFQKKREMETAKNSKLIDGGINDSILDQEEAQGRELVHSMVQSSTPTIAPVVRVLTNVQGKNKYYILKRIHKLTIIYPTGGMGKMRRNMENIHGFAQSNHKNINELKATIQRLESSLEAMGEQLQKATFRTVVSGYDLSEFFPVEKKEQLDLFMDREHPQWEARKSEFYYYLYTIATQNKKAFARGMIKAIFSRSYINKVKWPSTG